MWPWVLGVAVLAGAITFFVSSRQVKVYRATARLLSVQAGAVSGLNGLNVGLPTIPGLDSKAYQAAATSNEVLARLLERLQEGDDPAEIAAFKRRVRVRTVDGRQSSVLELSVDDPDPALAARKANQWSDVLQEWDDERARGHFRRYQASLEAQLDAVGVELRSLSPGDSQRRATLLALQASLLRDRDLIRALAETAVGQLTPLDRAIPPTAPARPTPVWDGGIAFLLASTLLIGFFLLRESLVQTIRDSTEAHRLTRLPVLGEFPKMPPANTRELPIEASNYLRTNLNHELMDQEVKVILVTSSEEGEGKSSVSLSLAKSYARAGKKTLLLDADLRRPTLHQDFKVSPEGIKDLVASLRDPFHQVSPVVVEKNLWLVPCFSQPEDPAELLSQHFKEFLRDLLEHSPVEVVIIDSAPILPVTDTVVMAPHVSLVLLTVSEARTDRRRLLATIEILKRIGARIGGLAMTNLKRGDTITTVARPYTRYGYGYVQKRERGKQSDMVEG